MTQEFQWDDKLVKEYHQWLIKEGCGEWNPMDKFKASKQPEKTYGWTKLPPEPSKYTEAEMLQAQEDAFFSGFYLTKKNRAFISRAKEYFSDYMDSLPKIKQP